MAAFTSLVRVRGLLRQDRLLASMMPQAERLQELNRRFAKAVTPAVARACRIVAVEGETALVHCSNGAAASRLRSQTGTVTRALSSARQLLTDLKVKVRADWSLPQKPEKRGMDRHALQAWAELDARLPEGGLKDAVERLIRHQSRIG